MNEPTELELKIVNRVFAPIMIVLVLAALFGIFSYHMKCRSACLDQGFSDWAMVGGRFDGRCECYGPDEANAQRSAR